MPRVCAIRCANGISRSEETTLTRTVLLACVLLSTLSLAAQESENTTEYGFWSGGNFATGHIVGYSKDQHLVPFGLMWAPVLTRHRHFAVRYRAELFPAVFLHDDRYASSGKSQPRGMRWVYGGGASPVGAQVDFGGPARIRPFFEVTGGFLYFTSRILGYDATQFNFTLAPGVGTHIAISPRTALMIGYKYHHMSNAELHHENPGLDSQELYFGVAFFRRR